MIVLAWVVGLAVLHGFVGHHVLREVQQGLGIFLCRRTGQSAPPWWLAWALAALAVGNISLPLLGAAIAAALSHDELSAVLLGYAGGGFAGDMLSTHVIPRLITGKTNPGLSTWFEQLVAFIVLAWLAPSPLPLVAGAASFVALWPLMALLRWWRGRAR